MKRFLILVSLLVFGLSDTNSQTDPGPFSFSGEPENVQTVIAQLSALRFRSETFDSLINKVYANPAQQQPIRFIVTNVRKNRPVVISTIGKTRYIEINLPSYQELPTYIYNPISERYELQTSPDWAITQESLLIHEIAEYIDILVRQKIERDKYKWDYNAHHAVGMKIENRLRKEFLQLDKRGIDYNADVKVNGTVYNGRVIEIGRYKEFWYMDQFKRFRICYLLN